jgi:hypothetical protein
LTPAAVLIPVVELDPAFIGCVQQQLQEWGNEDVMPPTRTAKRLDTSGNVLVLSLSNSLMVKEFLGREATCVLRNWVAHA